MDPNTIEFGWHDVAGTFSYVLIAVSYWLTSIYWLRVAAVVGLTAEILYFWLSGGPMFVGMSWNLVFIAINLYQLYWLFEERRRFSSAGAVRDLRKGAFAHLDPVHLARLMRAGAWRTFEDGQHLTTEYEPVDALYFIGTGSAEVVAKGTAVARLGPGALVGEMAFVSGDPASATVRSDGSLDVFVFNAARLRALLSQDEAVAAALHQTVGRDLAAKLKAQTPPPGAAEAED